MKTFSQDMDGSMVPDPNGDWVREEAAFEEIKNLKALLERAFDMLGTIEYPSTANMALCAEIETALKVSEMLNEGE